VDKINIVSSQAVLEMSSFSMDTRSMYSSPLVSSLVRNRLSRTALTSMSCHFYSSTLWICLGRHDAAWQPRSHNPQDWDLGCLEATGWVQERLAFLDAAVQLLPVCGAVCRCMSCWNIKSLPDTLHIAGCSMTSLWCHEAASKKSVRDITRISWFATTMKLPHALQI